MARRGHWCALLLLALHCLVPGTAQAGRGLWDLQDEFVDENGTRARLVHWGGPQTVVAMEYSECKFVCSTNWRRLLDIQAVADQHQLPLRFLIISLDPAHDTPQEWRSYREVRGMQRSNWSFVTGSRQATDRVVAQLGVKWWMFNESIMHDFKLLRLDPEGRLLSVMDNYDDPADRFLGLRTAAARLTH